MKKVVVRVKTRSSSPVADLKQPFNTRLYKNSSAAGAIELAYLRGYQAGLEARPKGRRAA